MTVNGAVTKFIQNFMTSVNPQITKSYAQGNYDYLFSLINRSAKFSAFLALVLVVPIILHLDTILDLWLVEVPQHTNNFITLILIYSVVECFISPTLVALLATGKIKNYEIGITFIYCLNILSIYLFFKNGAIPEMAFILNVVFKVIVLIFILFQSGRQYRLQVLSFLRDAMGRLCIVGVIGIIMIYSYNKIIAETTIFSFLISLILTELILLSVIWFIVMKREEKTFIKNIIKTKIFKRV